MTHQDRVTAALDCARDGIPHGEPEKMWLIDQMIRALTGCPRVDATVIIDGQEIDTTIQGESEEYLAFIEEMTAGDDLEWDHGIEPVLP